MIKLNRIQTIFMKFSKQHFGKNQLPLILEKQTGTSKEAFDDYTLYEMLAREIPFLLPPERVADILKRPNEGRHNLFVTTSFDSSSISLKIIYKTMLSQLSITPLANYSYCKLPKNVNDLVLKEWKNKPKEREL